MLDNGAELIGLTEAEDALSAVEGVPSRREVSVAGRAGPAPREAPPDLLLATVFDDQRTWEVACDTIGDTLNRVRMGTLTSFLA